MSKLVDPWTQDLIKEIDKWIDEEKKENPSWSLVIGARSFSLDQIREHINEQTPEGKMILRMVAKMAIDRFKRQVTKED